jgi:hypothetical protein
VSKPADRDPAAMLLLFGGYAAIIALTFYLIWSSFWSVARGL